MRRNQQAARIRKEIEKDHAPVHIPSRGAEVTDLDTWGLRAHGLGISKDLYYRAVVGLKF